LSYVDAFYNKDKDIVQVVERSKGKRVYNDYPAWRTFYVKDPRGDHLSIHGDKVRQIKCKRLKDLHKERKINSGKAFYESDMKPEVKCLSENYNGIDSPTLNTAFFDIETDFDASRGFADPSDPFMPITAITVHLQWLELLVTLVIPPKGMREGEGLKEAQRICEQFENTELYLSEADMLNDFMDVIEDADVLTGWNSEGYDIPYTVNRITRVLSKSHTRKMCLWDLYPQKRKIVKYGKEQETFDLFGRIHLDYLELYRKYTYHEMHSYALDTIGEHEVGEKKVAYDGTLDQLYNNDFYKFVAYNRQDVALLDKIDKKLRFIELANEIAHDNTVNIKTTMGAVAVTEQAIINEAHRRGMVVPDRKRREWSDDDIEYSDEELQALELQKAAGAFVAVPKAGLQRWVAGIDINSLYPSVIRAMNMSPETIAGQLRPDLTEQMIGSRIKEGRKTGAKGYGSSQAWDETFSSEEFRLVNEKDKASNITLVLEDSTVEENKTTQDLTGAEAYDLVFNSGLNWSLTANGTIFKQDVQGIIPSLLERWYAERQVMQQKKKEAIKDNDAVAIAHWDKRQLVKKINLNSLYGALLNQGCRFYDKRIGQSTTLTGRCITRHMGAKTNEVIAGTYDYQGPSVIYGDTDSIYYSMYPVYKQEIDDGTIEWNKDKVLQLYDEVANQVNESFPDFMKTFFNVPRKEGEIIVAGRENCATMGIFIKKKRYAMLIYDDDGERRDVDGKPGKIKAMGLDLKRSDTPKYMQNFLSEVLLKILTDGTRENVIDMVKEFKKEFRTKPGWEKGSQSRVNNLTSYKNRVNASKKAMARDMNMGGDKSKRDKVHLPGHVSAALNWNMLRELNQDRYAVEIVDGMKCIICKLKPNTFKLKSVAYPIDATKIPQWFQDLPFDHELMEQTIVDKKLDNLIGVLKWDMSDANASETFDNLFEL
jgi:DNA polymerase elongation subunit (family B)